MERFWDALLHFGGDHHGSQVLAVGLAERGQWDPVELGDLRGYLVMGGPITAERDELLR
ncbi:hypothetical protein [Dactylosporangium matsuzakiense]|uniref:Uncharacterized protein n=1 Tax=Dactylosporangium matsuzakiense TaxID=53360 RepID=A0A9W6KWH0_9ACTN|nr:hypothetical protein [Dactylosporangium matsuzakiense]UWZ47771.1 hypothetical protein Dmats_16020 [Dactylosporangium matsuzakiense]GLL08460.1 hypothetical protein GCM10017581_102230 [Dactylosporangium matsuzakiense]